MNFTMDPIIITLIILALIVLVLAYMVYALNSKLQKILVGEKVENLNHFKKEITDYLETVENRLKKSIQAVHTVRFNPFKGTTGSGGNQSFATAFINEKGDGVVVSSLYAREHVSIFSKPIVKGASEYELSDEEKEAVDTAVKMVK